MDFLTLAKTRCSVRKYEPEKVTQSEYAKIMEAGRVAPTACNNQPQKIIAIQSAEGLAKLRKAANVYGAPLALIVCADHNESWKRSYDGKDTADIDAAIVTTHMMLQAAELGLHSLWVCHFKPDVLRAEFNLPDHLEAINILGIGHAAEGAVTSPGRHDTQRKPLFETVFEEKLSF